MKNQRTLTLEGSDLRQAKSGGGGAAGFLTAPQAKKNLLKGHVRPVGYQMPRKRVRTTYITAKLRVQIWKELYSRLLQTLQSEYILPACAVDFFSEVQRAQNWPHLLLLRFNCQGLAS
ncbi:hypothetical protein LOAG_03923 [Loa loa]|uniref:Uncharacterized protein n=1 Tax=Loa loa TaxID=7209 RepID=A0A1S0U502_LOALO|nr:hypothetical protein LOAG_03923 [Loa loa]EFO24556.1 hypothetical protein LOAG_03923 [Loa loa]